MKPNVINLKLFLLFETMWINHFTQIDLARGRFWMDLCAGRDQVAVHAHRHGWASYEAHCPRLIVNWCIKRPLSVIDVGANTGFYTLLSAASGAKRVLAIEPFELAAQIMKVNLEISSLSECAQILSCALSNTNGEQGLAIPDSSHGLVETSASLNLAFRSNHSALPNVRVTTLDHVLESTNLNLRDCSLLIKLDVDSLELDVIKGASKTIATLRPALITEVLTPDALEAWQMWAASWRYQFHPWIESSPWLGTGQDSVQFCSNQRNYVLLPEEASAQWIHDGHSETLLD